MKQLYSTRTSGEAHSIRLFLDSQGVPAVVCGDASGVEVGFAFTPNSAPCVFVGDTDFERATDLLTRYEAQADSQTTRGNWICRRCGESMHATFDICWNCESPHDDASVHGVLHEMGELSKDSPPPGAETTIDDQSISHTESARSKYSLWFEVIVVLLLFSQYFGLPTIVALAAPTWLNERTFTGQCAWPVAHELIVAVFTLAVIYRSREPWSKFGLSRPRWLLDTFGGAILFAIVVRVLYITNDLLVGVLDSLFAQETVRNLLTPANAFIDPHGGSELAFAAIAAILIGFSEELVMRGYLIPRLEYLLGTTWISVLVASLVFAEGHWTMGMAGVWNAFIMGLVFGGVFAYFRRLWPLVAAHAVIDFVAFLNSGYY